MLIVVAVDIGLSLLAFLIDAEDKSAAIHRRWRPPEQTLHLLGVAGGWPGTTPSSPALAHPTQARVLVQRPIAGGASLGNSEV